MKEHRENDLIFFGESCSYEENNAEDKELAKTYLKLWKKMLLRKLREELHNYEPYDGQVVDGAKMKADPDGWYEHWVDRPAMFSGLFATYASLCLKFCMKRKLPYQL